MTCQRQSARWEVEWNLCLILLSPGCTPAGISRSKAKHQTRIMFSHPCDPTGVVFRIWIIQKDVRPQSGHLTFSLLLLRNKTIRQQKRLTKINSNSSEPQSRLLPSTFPNRLQRSKTNRVAAKEIRKADSEWPPQKNDSMLRRVLVRGWLHQLHHFYTADRWLVHLSSMWGGSSHFSPTIDFKTRRPFWQRSITSWVSYSFSYQPRLEILLFSHST